MLQECIIFGGLAWVKPDRVQEKSPGHNSWPRPDQPCRRENDENRCKLIKHQKREHPSVVRPLPSNEMDFSRRLARGTSDHKSGATIIDDEAKASQGRHRTRTSE